MKKFFLLPLLFAAIPLVSSAQSQPTSVAASVASACGVELTWADGGAGTSYFGIERATGTPSASQASLYRLIATTTAQSLYDQNLTPGSVYSYRIYAVSGSDRSAPAYPTPSAVTTKALPSASTPASFAANQDPNLDAYGGEMARLTWAASTFSKTSAGDALLYELGRSANNGTSYTTLTSNLPFTNYDDSNLSPSISYRYRVRAIASNADCAPTVLTASSYATISVPIAPKGLAAVFNVDDSSINLTWTAGSGQSNYEIFRTSGSQTNAYTQIGTSGGTSYKDTAVASGQGTNSRYWYKVRGCLGSGTAKTCSAFASMGVNIEAARAPQGFGARVSYASATSTIVTVSWKNNFAGWGQFIQTSDNGTSFTGTGVSKYGTDAGTIWNSAFSVPLNSTKTYRVYAELASGNSDYASGAVDTSVQYVLHGAAWGAYSNTGVGWVVFNSDDAGLTGTTPWSVQINRDGQMSGVAWVQSAAETPGYGWLSFNQVDLIGCPDDPTNAVPSTNCNAVLKDGELRGWARFISPKYDAATSSFSGWVSLNSKKVDGGARAGDIPRSATVAYFWNSLISSPVSWTPKGIIEKAVSVANDLAGIVKAYAATGDVAYGISLSSSTLSGAAWGSEGVGWLVFTDVNGMNACGGLCPVRAVSINTPPTVSNVVIRTPNTANSIWCATTPYYSIDFDYSDPDLLGNSPDTIAQMRVALATAPGAATTQVQTYSASSVTISQVNESTIRVSGVPYNDPLAHASANASYVASVQALDTNGGWSEWSYSSPTTTPAYYYPLVSFTLNPDPAVARKPIKYTDTTLVRTGGVPVAARQWVFKGGTPPTSASSTLTVIFATSTLNTAGGSLSITDQAGHMCTRDLPPVEASTSTPGRTIEEGAGS